MSTFIRVARLIAGLLGVSVDVLILFCLAHRSSSALAAENLFLRKQLSLYVERKKKPLRATDRIRFTLVHLSKHLQWRDALTIVKPDTLIRWHRKGFRLFWKWKSQSSGRPRVPTDLRKLIMEMATSNPTWGQKRIANELLLKIGIQISPRTVQWYMPNNPKRPTVPSQRWMTFVRNHTKAIIAADFFVVVTATFRLIYVFLIMEIETRRILHFNARSIRQRNGLCNSFENASPAMRDTSSLFTTGIAFIPGISIRHFEPSA
jgi:putative transposase